MGKLCLGTENECYICGATRNLERHHIYAGVRRSISEKYGACVMLCHEHHQGKYGAHGIGKLKDRLKREGQISLMRRQNWAVSDFMKVFGKSYL